MPFASKPRAPAPAYVAAYQSALAVNDLVTVVLIFLQFKLAQSRAILAVASAYLFTAILAVLHQLTFPGLFAEHGLFGAGPQSTVWLYMLWHGVFPLLLIAYTLMKGRRGDHANPRSHACCGRRSRRRRLRSPSEPPRGRAAGYLAFALPRPSDITIRTRSAMFLAPSFSIRRAR